MSLVGKLKIGTQVLVTSKDKFVDKKAVVMYVGILAGKNQEFVGVQLDTPDGTHSGTFEAKQYFKAKENHGLFSKAKTVKFLDGTPVTNLLTAPVPATTATKPKPTTTTTKTVPAKTVPTQSKPATTKAPVVVKKAPENKLSDQLKQVENNEQLENLKEQLEEAKRKIEALESTDAQQQLTAMKHKIRELDDQNRMLKVQQEKAKLQTSESSQQKTRQLQEKISFFNSQKEFQQKQKSELKKKILRLQQQLDSYQGNLQQFQKLTFKVQNLQAKNAKLREQLQSAKTEARNSQMLKPAGKQGGNDSKLQEMEEDIKILNETISMLQGDLNEEKEKSTGLEKQLQTIKAKGGDVTKLQKKLRARDEQLQALKAELQAVSDAATFAQKLTLDLLRKQELLKESTSKLSGYLNQIESLQIQLSESKQMIELTTVQMETQEEEIQKVMNEKTEQQNHITQLNKQISKYKSRIAQLSQNNESLLNSQIMDLGDDEITMKQFPTTDLYQHKYFQTLKTVQQLSQKYLSLQLQSSSIKNIVGVQMLNLIETIPQSYTQQFYPEIIKVIIDLKSANDKLYLLFDTASSYIRTRSDIYAKDNLEKAKWLVMLLEQVPLLYGQLTRIEMSLTTAETQEEISDIVSNTALKQIISRIDINASEILQRFAADNIDPSIDLEPFIEPVQTLDNICAQGRKLQYEHQTRNKLSTQTMATIHKIFEVVLTFKQNSEVGENAQVDTMIQTFLNSLLVYLKECCTNPHLRIKTETKQYLSGLELIIKILEEIYINETIAELSSLYSESEEIKMLKDTLMTTQFHLKQLINDLDDIVYSSQLSKIKSNLPGKVWVQRAQLINKQLNRVQELLSQKQDLQGSLLQAKKKILILQKQIKDRQSTKQLYQKRIGELQLKVEQASGLEGENKRNLQKLKSYEDSNKLIENELHAQASRRKELQQEIRKLKQRIEVIQVQGVVGKSKEKKISTAMTSGNLQEVTSLSLFKNVLQQCHTLRTLELKKRILQLKQSPLLAKLNPEQQGSKSESPSVPLTIRRKALDTMCQLKIINPMSKVSSKSSKSNSGFVVLQSLEVQANEYNFRKGNMEKKEKQQVVEMKIGSFMLRNTKPNQAISAKLDVGSYKVLSY